MSESESPESAALRAQTPITLIAQVAHPVDRDRRRALLSHLVQSGNWQQVLVFMRTKHGANRLTEQLMQDGIDAEAIHGNRSHGARARAFKLFKEAALRVLVVTDMAARGLDMETIPYVVNFDLPNVPEDYVHRVGRAGGKGQALTLLCGEERELLAEIEKRIDLQVERKIIEGFEPGPDYETARFDANQARGREVDVPDNARSDTAPAAEGDAARSVEEKPARPPQTRRPENRRNPPQQEAQRGSPRRAGRRPPAMQDATAAQPAVPQQRTETFTEDEDLDVRIDGNRIDYRSQAPRADQPNHGGSARKNARFGQPRGPRPAPVLEGPMTWRGQPVASANRPLEPHESRLHEYATRPQNANRGKRRMPTGLPRDEE